MNLTLSIIYLISTVTFVFGLKFLGHPETAKKGNLISGIGMVLAIIGTLVFHDIENVPTINYILIGAALLVGTILGWIMAMKVAMTKMPELVSLFNGFGGGSALLIGIIVYLSGFSFGKEKDFIREGANKRGNSPRLTQSFHFFMFEPIFSPVNALNQPI